MLVWNFIEQNAAFHLWFSLIRLFASKLFGNQQDTPASHIFGIVKNNRKYLHRQSVIKVSIILEYNCLTI